MQRKYCVNTKHIRPTARKTGHIMFQVFMSNSVWVSIFTQYKSIQTHQKSLYLRGEAVWSCAPVCLCSWYSPGSRASGPGPGSPSWQHPAGRHRPSAGPGCPCPHLSPCPAACCHHGSSCLGRLHAEQKGLVDRFYKNICCTWHWVTFQAKVIRFPVRIMRVGAYFE